MTTSSLLALNTFWLRPERHRENPKDCIGLRVDIEGWSHRTLSILCLWVGKIASHPQEMERVHLLCQMSAGSKAYPCLVIRRVSTVSRCNDICTMTTTADIPPLHFSRLKMALFSQCVFLCISWQITVLQQSISKWMIWVKKEAPRTCVRTKMEDKFQEGILAISTLQQNGLVAVKFDTIAGCTRAICNAANMDDMIHMLVTNKVLM